METKRLGLTVPNYFSENSEIEWLVTNNSRVEVGDPIAVAEKDGERYLAVSPVAGILRRIGSSPLLVAGLGLTLAYISVLAVESDKKARGTSKMSKAREVYLAKLTELVKDAVKEDFQKVNERFASLEKTIDSKITTVQNSVQDIKNHFKIK